MENNRGARERWLIAAMMLPNGIALIASGMLTVSLPVIQVEYGVPVELLAWAVAAVFIPRIAVEPIYGRLADMLGKRRLYLVGLVLFTFGAGLLLLDLPFVWVVIASALQGFGVASFSIAMAMITELFPVERRGRILGWWTAANPFGLMVGPIIGGMITEWIGWRANFFFITLACLAMLYIVVRFVPAENKFRSTAPFDWIGALGLASGVGGALLAATTSSVIPFGSPLNLALWLIAALGFIALIWDAKTRPHPLISADIIRNRRFIGPSLAVSLRMFAHDGGRFVLVLYLANVLRESPGIIGWAMFLYSMPLFLGVMFGGYLADRWTTRASGAIGTLGLAAGLVWIGWIAGSEDIIALAPGMIIGGLFSGIALVPFTKEAVAALGLDRAGLAAGLFNTIRFIGSAAATPLLGLSLAHGFAISGGPSRPGPYQLTFQLLAVVAVLAALAVMIIPAPDRAELVAEGVATHD